jgi:hypothetical protein
MKKAEQKEAEKKRQRSRGFKKMLLKEGLSLSTIGKREPVNNLRPSIRQRLSQSAKLCHHHPQARRQKRVKPTAARGPVKRTCKKVMTMCPIWHQNTCPILTRMRGMGTPTIHNRISQIRE